MSRKHFKALANLMHELRATESFGNASYEDGIYDGRSYQYKETLNAIAKFCASENPRFDEVKWRAYIDRPE